MTDRNRELVRDNRSLVKERAQYDHWTVLGGDDVLNPRVSP